MHRRILIIALAASVGSAGVASSAGKPGAAAQTTAAPLASALTESECERIGGEVGTVAPRTCATRMQCTVVKPNGGKRSICIDELE